MEKIVDKTIRISHIFDVANGFSFEDAEKRMLWSLLEMAIETGQISLPDRHPGATKHKQFVITFSRTDSKDWQLNMPESEIEMTIMERKQFRGI